MIEITCRKAQIGQGVEYLREVCFECSVCSLHCVVQNVEGYDGKNTFVYDLFQSNEPWGHRALWACSGCHKCYETCPQDADPLRVISVLRQQAFVEGIAPPYVYDLITLVLETGRAFPVTKKTLKDREKLGLREPEPTPVDEIGHIAGRTGLLEKLGKREK
ncbi:MAG: hypothetical protein JXO48_10220 [Deltaproteobacteria bacterium]|nr:hypothetical protein [Deltaproteobacteria bacterium]